MKKLYVLTVFRSFPRAEVGESVVLRIVALAVIIVGVTACTSEPAMPTPTATAEANETATPNPLLKPQRVTGRGEPFVVRGYVGSTFSITIPLGAVVAISPLHASLRAYPPGPGTVISNWLERGLWSWVQMAPSSVQSVVTGSAMVTVPPPSSPTWISQPTFLPCSSRRATVEPGVQRRANVLRKCAGPCSGF